MKLPKIHKIAFAETIIIVLLILIFVFGLISITTEKDMKIIERIIDKFDTIVNILLGIMFKQLYDRAQSKRKEGDKNSKDPE